MKNLHIFNKNIKLNFIFLTIIITIQIIEYLIIKPHIYQSDDIFYINSAFSILDGNFKFIPSVFNQRFGVFLPVCLFYQIFGVGPYTSTIFLLISAITSTVIIFIIGNKIKASVGILAAFIFACNPLTVSSTVDLLPDILCSTLILISTYYLFITMNDNNLEKEKIHGFLSALFLFLSVFVKEYIVFYLPFFVFICIIRYKKNPRFWNTFFLTSSAFIILFGLFYKIETGSFLYRLTAIESEHNSSLWSYYFSSNKILQDRILFGLYEFFLHNTEFSVLIVFVIPVLIFKIRDIEEENLRFWIYNFIILFIIFQYGSTSLREYNPIPLKSRMFICLLPAMCILSAYTIQEIYYNKNKKWIYLMMNIAFIWVLSYLPEYFYFGTNLILFFVSYLTLFLILLLSKKPQYRITLLIFPLIFMCAVIISTIYRLHNFPIAGINFIYISMILVALFLSLLSPFPQLRVILLISPLIYISVHFLIYQKSPVNNTEDLYKNYIGKLNDNSLVLMCNRNITANKYFNFNNTNHLVFMDWSDAFKDSLKSSKNNGIYLYVDYEMVIFLNKSYNTYIPKFISNIPPNWQTKKIYYRNYGDLKLNEKGIGLYKVSSLKGFRDFY